MKIILLLLITFCLFGSLRSQTITEQHRDSLEHAVVQYFKSNVKIFKATSNRTDIDQLFKQLTPDFKYIHPRYGGTYSRADLYEGYINNQTNGGYNGSIVDYEIKNMVIGLNGVAVDRVYIKKSANGEIEEVDPGMTLFEFQNGMISAIREYW